VTGTGARRIHPVALDAVDVCPLIDLQPFVGILEPREDAQPPEIDRNRSLNQTIIILYYYTLRLLLLGIYIRS